MKIVATAFSHYFIERAGRSSADQTSYFRYFIVIPEKSSTRLFLDGCVKQSLERIANEITVNPEILGPDSLVLNRVLVSTRICTRQNSNLNNNNSSFPNNSAENN